MSAASDLREAIFKASNAHDLYDDGIDAILDAVIAALPELMSEDLIAISLHGIPDDAKEGSTPQDSVNLSKAYNAALNEVKAILQSAKTQKGEE